MSRWKFRSGVLSVSNVNLAAHAALESPEQGQLPIARWTRHMLHIAGPANSTKKVECWLDACIPMYSPTGEKINMILMSRTWLYHELIKSLRMLWVSTSFGDIYIFGTWLAHQLLPRLGLSAPTFHKSVLSPRWQTQSAPTKFGQFIVRQIPLFNIPYFIILHHASSYFTGMFRSKKSRCCRHPFLFSLRQWQHLPLRTTNFKSPRSVFNAASSSSTSWR